MGHWERREEGTPGGGGTGATGLGGWVVVRGREGCSASPGVSLRLWRLFPNTWDHRHPHKCLLHLFTEGKCPAGGPRPDRGERGAMGRVGKRAVSARSLPGNSVVRLLP